MTYDVFFNKHMNLMLFNLYSRPSSRIKYGFVHKWGLVWKLGVSFFFFCWQFCDDYNQ